MLSPTSFRQYLTLWSPSQHLFLPNFASIVRFIAITYTSKTLIPTSDNSEPYSEQRHVQRQRSISRHASQRSTSQAARRESRPRSQADPGREQDEQKRKPLSPTPLKRLPFRHLRISSRPLTSRTGPPRSRLKTQAGLRHPSPPPTPNLAPRLRRELRTGNNRKGLLTPPRYPLALYRRSPDEQMQGSSRERAESMVREQRRCSQEGGCIRQRTGCAG